MLVHLGLNLQHKKGEADSIGFNVEVNSGNFDKQN